MLSTAEKNTELNWQCAVKLNSSVSNNNSFMSCVQEKNLAWISNLMTPFANSLKVFFLI